MRAKKLNGFSLMEMMIVLLIVAIIAAASAPMVTKKLSRSAGTGDSPWVFTGLNNSIAYNMSGNDNSTVIIGSTTTPANMQGSTRLYIDSGNNASHIAFGNGNTVPLLLTADPTRGRIGFSNQEIPDSSVAFGINQTLSGDHIVAIGAGAIANNSGAIGIGRAANARSLQSIAIGGSETDRTIAAGDNAIAIGSEAETDGAHSIAIGSLTQAIDGNAIAIGQSAVTATDNSIAIGTSSSAGNRNSGRWEAGRGAIYGDTIAIGHDAQTNDYGSIAIGYNAQVNTADTGGDYSIAIGANARANHDFAVALGYNAETRADNQIVLGDENTTVYIPGHLAVGNFAALGVDNQNSRIYIRGWRSPASIYQFVGADKIDGKENDSFPVSINSIPFFNGKYTSDRRLKNVGDKYTAGLDELKKLDFFHFTFKQDEEKTPHVGVMAQDLQKVFPDAVTKGEDGYLRIRLEEMFYAVINAVKELDNKTAEIVHNITDINSTIEKQNKTIEEQQKTIDKIQKTMEEQQKVIEKLEKQIKKLD